MRSGGEGRRASGSWRDAGGTLWKLVSRTEWERGREAGPQGSTRQLSPRLMLRAAMASERPSESAPGLLLPEVCSSLGGGLPGALWDISATAQLASLFNHVFNAKS